MARPLRSEQGHKGRTMKAQSRGTLVMDQLPRLTPRRGQHPSLQRWSLAGATRREGATSQEISRPWQKGS